MYRYLGVQSGGADPDLSLIWRSGSRWPHRGCGV